ncbi:MAG: hypothetical protein D8M59_13105 [Planctomycetes bacterium]|nr:hypothetical protein [Planctomycetota bacterium]NOG54942.1 PQQ-binding-like beta-propeller repeat protein [Planctomycetota bacterium]
MGTPFRRWVMCCLAVGGGSVHMAHTQEAEPAPEPLWTVPTSAPSYGSASAGDIDGDGKLEIVFGTYFNDEHLYILNCEDGSIVWKRKSIGGPLDASVLLFDVNSDGALEMVYGDSAYGTLWCLAGDGTEVWKYKGQSGTDSPPAAADLDGDGTIEVVYGTMKNTNGSGNGHVNVLNGKDGTLKWTAEVPGHVQSEPALVDVSGDGVLDVLVTNWHGDDQLRALNGVDGSELWAFTTGDSVYHGVSVSDFDTDEKPEVVVADRRGTVWMLEGEDGSEKWKASLESEAEGMVFGPTSLVDVEGDGVFEIAIAGRHLHVLDAGDGSLRWRSEYAVGRSIARGVAVGDVTGDGKPNLVMGHGRMLRVVDAADGRTVWEHEIRSGDAQWEGIDHAPLLLDCDGDGQLDIFVVSGRGLSGETEGENYGQASVWKIPAAESAHSSAVAPVPWLTFRGNVRRTGRVQQEE